MLKYIIFTVLTFSLISCSGDDSSYDDEIASINNSNIKEAIELANQWRSEKKDITSYIDTEYLICIFPDGREIKKKLPSDELYIAVAPYINETHECSLHYISSCMGELLNETFQLNILGDDGNIIFNDDIKALNNGFFEIWLPRNTKITVNINYNSYQGGFQTTTNKDMKTCWTTVKLN